MEGESFMRNNNLMRIKFTIVLVSWFLLAAKGWGQTGSLEGRILDKQTLYPLQLVNVWIEGTNLGTATDKNGSYRLQAIPAGTYTVRFSMIGYEPMSVADVDIGTGVNKLDALLEETTLRMSEVVVTPKPERYDASGISARLGKEMVASAPGSAQDIFWVVQTLPGISSDGDNSKLYVRGGSPDENLVLYDGATIRNPFHFDMMGGGYWSIFNSRLVEKVEFYAGGFPARYGDRLSSVLLIENRTANMERLKGEASISMSDASGTVEVPIAFANGAAMLSARRSYFDMLLKYTDLATDYSVLPYFFDVNSKFDFNLPQKHHLTISGLYTRERMYGYFDKPNYKGNLSWENKSGVATGRLRSLLGEFFLSDFIVSWSQAKSSSLQPRNAVEAYNIQEWTLKQDFTIMFPANELHIGGWFVREKEDVTIDLPLEIALNFNELKLRGTGTSVKPSLYVDDKWTISRTLTASVGIRYDYIAKSKESTLSPRFNLSYAWNEHMSLSADYGWYYQSPRPYELDINTNLKSKRAESYGIGIKHEVSDAMVVSLELYNKNLSRLITIDSTWNLANEGYGYSRGAEFYIQLKNAQGFFGWLSYTYSISKRKEGRNNDLHFFDYDRPHLISLVANYKFTEHWQAGLRFRYGSGRPYTPVASSWYDPGEDRWFPILGIYNSDRYPAYNRLDVRVTRHFQFGAFDLDAYVEILNAYNQKNIIHYMWDERYVSKDALTIFPFLPVVGITARF